jgi:hypothetical protein
MEKGNKCMPKTFILHDKIRRMISRFFPGILFLFLPVFLSGQSWQPDAGLVKPYPATVSVSSGQNPQYITDGNPHTFWQSGSALPQGYIRRPDLNYFLNKHYITDAEAASAFDGNTDTYQTVTDRQLNLSFATPVSFYRLSLKADVNDTLFLLLETTGHKQIRLKYLPSEKFRLKNFSLNPDNQLVSIRLSCRSPYRLYEMAALDAPPTEFVVFDFGKPVDIGWISSRHLNNAATSIQVLAGNDKAHWQPIIHLNPRAIPLLYNPLSVPIRARYLKVVFSLPLKDYQKSVLWEFAAYDKQGPYGPRPPAEPSPNTFSQTFGINTVWGWGYSVYSDRLKPDAGPGKFITVAKNVRSYERLDWDMVTPQHVPDFDRMAAGHGTPAKPWLNWDREYKTWKQKGFHIDITLAFKQDNFPDTLWKNPYEEAFVFGKAYAAHFYQKEHLVDVVETGNEPWNYNSATYRKILAGLADGAHSVSDLPVLPCAVQAFDPQKDDNNYISHYLDASSQNVDGLNTHIYSYVFQENGQRKAVAPEDPRSEIWSMNNLVRFRDINLPGKPVYVTEFGYDSGGGGETCTHSECISEREQAVFGLRMAMILWRLGARQFYWYYFANVAYRSFLHNRSGLTGSYKTGFRDKLSFRTFAFLQKQIGNYRFAGIVREDTEVYAYLLEDFNTHKKIIIAWRPTLQYHFVQKQETIPVPGQVSHVVYVTQRQPVPFQAKNHSVRLKLSGVPLLIFIK